MPGRRISVFLLTAAVLFASCGRKVPQASESRMMLGTVCRITVRGGDIHSARAAIDGAFAAVDRLQRLAGYGPESDVGRINAAAGIRPVRVSGLVAGIIEDSLKISKLSGGAFDISYAPFRKLWGFGSDEEKVPTKKEVTRALKLVGYKKIEFNARTNEVFLRKKGMRIDLGGIAKGKAIDIAADVLKKEGVKSALVDFGGDVYAFGREQWTLGIKHPRKSSALLGRLPVKNAAAATSGDYERFFIKNGKRYHHIIDPSTGFPADESVSVTVTAPDAETADALATALFVMGPEAASALTEKLPGVESVIVGTGKKPEIKISSGLKGLKISY